MKTDEAISEKPQSNDSAQDTNFIYEKLIQFLQFYTITPLDKYTANQLKLLDTENKISNQTMSKVNNIFNHLRNEYIDEISTEINKFVAKFNLKEKLKYKSDAMLVELLLKELNIPLETILKYESFAQMDNVEECLLQHCLTEYLKGQNKVLLETEEAKKKELAMLKEKNKIKFNL